ncbi:MAG: hypothetical protein C6I01_04235 [Epsilonproteobacteria bacterium]|nr:hypothetical protein [Campylobacterota bacterium]NPA89607.1 peptidoglycan DD-metalloendopeptidase family protein [Campylobacterota bacterium]
MMRFNFLILPSLLPRGEKGDGERVKSIIAPLLLGIGLTFTTPVSVAGASLKKTKQKLAQTQRKLSYYNRQLGGLKHLIEVKRKDLIWLTNRLNYTQKQIAKLSQELKDSSQVISKLERKRGNLQKQIKEIEDQIAIFLSQNYYLDNQQVESISDLINSAIYKQISQQYAQKIAQLLKEKKILEQDIRKINRQINSIKSKKEKLEKQKKYYLSLQKKRDKELSELKQKLKLYWQKIQQLKQRQASLQAFLEKMKIVKKDAVQMKESPKKFYRLRFVAPVAGQIIQRFGSYVDPLYHIRIYNNSIVIKTQPNAKIHAVERGEVVYIGDYGGKKIIFIKHPNGVFSIYSNLTKVSPFLKKGYKVRRGEIIARVKNSLEFAMSYKENYVNPLRYLSIPKPKSSNK